jgi:hypothetical protein
MRRDGSPIGEALKGTRVFSVVGIVGGLAACVAGAVTQDTVPIVLGAIAMGCGAVLAVLTFLAHRKTGS